MNPEKFNRYRAETLWPEVTDQLDEYDIETVRDYLDEVVDDVPSEVASWCENHSEARHIFTRYYPYTEQPVTLCLSNPRLDYDWDDDDEEIAHIEDDFPTLEHRRYAATEPDDIKALSNISSEHYSGYLYGSGTGTKCLLKRLGTVTGDLSPSKAVQSPPEKKQRNENREAENSGEGDGSTKWDEYFYNPDETEGMNLEDITGTHPLAPMDLLERTENSKGQKLKGGNRGISARKPDIWTGLYDDIYITNMYKLGTRGYSDESDVPTDESHHIEITAEELEKTGSELVIAAGKPAQKVLIKLGDVEYDPKDEYDDSTEPLQKEEYDKPKNPDDARREHYGVVWKLGSERYGLAVPHLSRFNGELGQAFSKSHSDEKNSDCGWRVLSDSLNWLGKQTAL